MDESEFQTLLQQAEPQTPPIDRGAIVAALTVSTSDLPISRSADAGQALFRSRPSTGRRGLAVGCVTAVLACLALAVMRYTALINDPSPLTDEQLLAAYRQSQTESAAMEATLRQLTATPDPLLSPHTAADIRAAESLWLLLQADSGDQRSQAETIVTLYANTPAASRCREMFPDIIVN